MWYESEMVTETLDSIYEALSYTNIPVRLRFCLNSQTYLEKPIEGRSEDMFNEFINHPIMEKVEILYKTDKDSFFNIGDWRREQYDKNSKYTVWGESDCLLPRDFFYILSEVSINQKHLISFASRKMWDTTWDCVEHIELKKYPRTLENVYQAPIPFNSCDIINQSQLDEFNIQYDIDILLNNDVKVDGSLLCISNNIDFLFIPEGMHFVREDFCAEQVFKIKRIPQYIVSTRIKGHNYSHAKKRLNTVNSREDVIFKQYEEESTLAMTTFLNKIR
jgi:hypothetical protein